MSQHPADVLRELLAVLERRLSDLMFHLYRARHRLTEIQERVGTDALILARVGEALTSVRESERVVADIQQQIKTIRDFR
jgi:hypothetical protein